MRKDSEIWESVEPPMTLLRMPFFEYSLVFIDGWIASAVVQ